MPIYTVSLLDVYSTCIQHSIDILYINQALNFSTNTRLFVTMLKILGSFPIKFEQQFLN